MRTLLALSLLLAGCTGSGTLDTDPTPAPDEDPTPPPGCGETEELTPGRVLTTSGVVQGTDDGSITSFLGVPFAEAPVGDLRFAEPEPYDCREGVLVADAFAPVCPQADDDGVFDGDEDCLYLNVWTPSGALSDGAPRPVLFFVHGGGHVAGSTSNEVSGVSIYDGQALAEAQDVVVVTTAYRLGALGFLAHRALADSDDAVSGNLGTRDQQVSLRWVQDNIAGFGGDPERVLLFGESAGAVETCAHLASPGSAGLFSAALMESGGCTAKTEEDAFAQGAERVELLGCTGDDVLGCLRAASVEDLVSLNEAPFDDGVFNGNGFGLTVDGDVLPAAPLAVVRAGEHNRVPFAIGANSDEQSRGVPPGLPTAAQYPTALQSLFGPLAETVEEAYPLSDFDSAHDAYVAILTDAQFVCPSRRIARTVRDAQDEPVFRYFFSRAPAGPAGQLYGAWHGLELLYVFAQLDAMEDAGLYTPEPADHAVSDAMGTAWANLAADGDPGPSWPEWDGDEQILEFGDVVQATDDVRVERCDLWDDLATLLGG